MMTRSAWVAALALAAALCWAAPASAHTRLVSTTPAPGAAVESLPAVSLTFSEPLLTIGARIVVLDAQGADHASGSVYFPDPRTIQVDVASLQAGAYTAQWRVVADDGHPIEGTLPFTVVSAPSPMPSATPTATPTAMPSAGPSATAEPSASGNATPIASPTSSPTQSGQVVAPAPEDESRTGLYATIAAIAGAVALVGAAVYLARPKDPLTGSRRHARR